MEIGEIIKDIKQAKTVCCPVWDDIKKEYDPMLHEVVTDKTLLKDITRKNGLEKSARVTYGFQKLAVKRMTQMAFSIPVKRVYDTGDDATKMEQAKAIEAVYRKAKIDNENIKRMKAFFGACEIVTVWFPIEKKNNYYGFDSDYKLSCITYSPMEEKYSGLSTAEIYPVFDKHGDLIKLGFEYIIKEKGVDVTYFHVYEAEKQSLYMNTKGKWEEVAEDTMPIGKIPAVYISRSMPIWENVTPNVKEIELALSRESNILRKNSAPILGVTGELIGDTKPEGEVSREVYQFSENGKVEYITWEQQIDAMKFYIQTLKQQNEEELQLPNLSLENIKGLGAISGEARKTLLTDAHLKVGDESGDIIEMLERECNVIKAYLAKMNKTWENSIYDLNVEHVITPFIQNDENVEIEKLVKASNKPIMSQLTAISRLGMVEDANKELQQLQAESQFENNIDVFNTAE